MPQGDLHRLDRGWPGVHPRCRQTIKPLSLELGGNAPLLVFEDADLKVAVEGALLAKMRNTGQSCIASNRLLVHRPIYQHFLEAFAPRSRR